MTGLTNELPPSGLSRMAESDFMSMEFPLSDTENILGNASRQAKEVAVKWQHFLLPAGGFAPEVGYGVQVKELWVQPHIDSEYLDEGQRRDVESQIRQGKFQGQVEVKMVSEIEVTSSALFSEPLMFCLERSTQLTGWASRYV